MADSISIDEYQKLLGSKKQKKKLKHPEQDLQIAIADLLNVLSRQHNFWFSHFPGGGLRTKAEAGIFKAMGTKAGPGDILIIPVGGIAHWIELKVGKNKQSDIQIAFEEEITALGCRYAVAWSIDDVIKILKTWELIT